MRAVRSAAALLAVAVAVAASSGASAAPTLRVRVLRLVDRSRVAHLGNGATVPRTLRVEIRVPPAGTPPFPLVVFAHGFVLVPGDYARLLDAWARAGYLVAAPVFPVESATAVGGPSRADLPNEPGDIRFVISRLLARGSTVRRLVDPAQIAVAGQSDGGVAALSAAFDRRYADGRIDASLVLSGATLPGFALARRSPPLLAVQGTADPFNAPSTTATYFAAMRRPKFLLWLEGAGHKEPYTTSDRWSGIVIRATVAFLDRYLRGRPLRPLLAAGRVPGLARLESDP